MGFDPITKDVAAWRPYCAGIVLIRTCSRYRDDIKQHRIIDGTFEDVTDNGRFRVMAEMRPATTKLDRSKFGLLFVYVHGI